MSAGGDEEKCPLAADVMLFTHRAVPAEEAASFERHLAGCEDCRQELERLRPLALFFTDEPSEVLHPTDAVRERLARRIADESGREMVLPTTPPAHEPDWTEVAPGISCKVLAADAARNRVSMLVRLAPGIAYPPHTHAGVEELHLLDGELWIGDRKLRPGDYNRAEPGTSDSRVWSETGCTCVLITSDKDILEELRQ